jgi:hypothetical protein
MAFSVTLCNIMKKLICIVFMIGSLTNIFGQTKNQHHILKGKISSKLEFLAFANIGIENKNIGTISNEEGGFEIEIPLLYSMDSLTISHIGYKSKKIKIESIVQEDYLEIELEQEFQVLDEVIVIANKRKGQIKELGNKKKRDMFLWIQNGDRGSEIVTLINTESELELHSVSINILNDQKKEFKLLLNIYDVNNNTNLPDNQLLKNQKIITSSQKDGWLEIDLNEENINIDQPFFIGIQWTSTDEAVPLVGGKIKRSENSLIRYKALGTWEQYAEWNIKIKGTVYK